MRWEDLFADLEAQLDADEAAGLAAEVADRTRREQARLTLLDRVAYRSRRHRESAGSAGLDVSAAPGDMARLGHLPDLGDLGDLVVGVSGAGALRGSLVDAAAEWLLVEDQPGRSVLVPMAACLWVQGLTRGVEVVPEQSVARRLSLGSALRTLARQRVPLLLQLLDGAAFTGTIDRVHADHIDLAEHRLDQPRRAAAVQGVRSVRIAAIALARSS